MKTYKDYVDICRNEVFDSLQVSEKRYGKDWWKSRDNDSNPNINDCPMIQNNTNMKNSDWVLFHHVLVRLVIDFMKEKNIDEIFSYNISINLNNKGKKWSIYLKKECLESIEFPDSEPYSFSNFDIISDEKIIEKFNDLNKNIYKLTNEFLNLNISLIPKTINHIDFGVSYLNESVKYGKWMSSTDSSLSAGWDKNGDEHTDELLVVSM